MSQKIEDIINPVRDPNLYFNNVENFKSFLKLLKSEVLNTTHDYSIVEIVGTSASGKTSFLNMIIKCLFMKKCPKSWEGVIQESDYQFVQKFNEKKCFSKISFLPMIPPESVSRRILNDLNKDEKDCQHFHIFIDELDRIFLKGYTLDRDYLRGLNSEFQKIYEYCRNKCKITFYFITSLPIVFRHRFVADLWKDIGGGSEEDKSFDLREGPRIVLDIPFFLDVNKINFFYLEISREKFTEKEVDDYIKKLLNIYNISEMEQDIINCIESIMGGDFKAKKFPIYYINAIVFFFAKNRSLKCENPDDFLIDLIKSFYRLHWDDLTTQHGLFGPGVSTKLYREFEKLLDSGQISKRRNDSISSILVRNNVAYINESDSKGNSIRLEHIWNISRLRNFGKRVTSYFKKRKSKDYFIVYNKYIEKRYRPHCFSFITSLYYVIFLIFTNLFPHKSYGFKVSGIVLLGFGYVFYYGKFFKVFWENPIYYFPIYLLNGIIFNILSLIFIIIFYMQKNVFINYSILFFIIILSFITIGILVFLISYFRRNVAR